MESRPFIKNKMLELKFTGMLRELDSILDRAASDGQSVSDTLALLLQAESDFRNERLIARRVHNSKLKGKPTLDDFDFTAKRSITKMQVSELYKMDWVKRGKSILVIGPTGVGKTFLAQALGHHACLQKHTVLFMTVSNYLEEQHISRMSKSYLRFRAKLVKPDLLILDDFGLKKLDGEEAHDLNDLLKERGDKSVILTTQLPLANWKEVLEDVVIADTIIDQLAHTSIKLKLAGESYRRIKGSRQS